MHIENNNGQVIWTLNTCWLSGLKASESGKLNFACTKSKYTESWPYSRQVKSELVQEEHKNPVFWYAPSAAKTEPLLQDKWCFTRRHLRLTWAFFSPAPNLHET
jgi:hypothetical protein